MLLGLGVSGERGIQLGDMGKSLVMGSTGPMPTPWPVPLFSSHQQAWPTQSCQPSRARRGDSRSCPASTLAARRQAAPRDRHGCDAGSRHRHLNALVHGPAQLLRRRDPRLFLPSQLVCGEEVTEGGSPLLPRPSLPWQGSCPHPTPSSRDLSFPRLRGRCCPLIYGEPGPSPQGRELFLSKPAAMK